jgi:hypothetical protein
LGLSGILFTITMNHYLFSTTRDATSSLRSSVLSNSKFGVDCTWQTVFWGVAPQTSIGKGWSRHLRAAIEARGRYAALQASHVGVGFAELPRCLN